jgi:hypothetical protein
MSSDEDERALKKQIFKNPVEVQKARLERLMKNVEKPVFIPEKKEIKPPRAFQPHEFVRNVMGKQIYLKSFFLLMCFQGQVLVLDQENLIFIVDVVGVKLFEKRF